MISLFLCILFTLASPTNQRIIDNVSQKEDIWKVYYSIDFPNADECRALRCNNEEACLVKGNEALCVKTHELNMINGYKFDVRSGQFIDNNENKNEENVGNEIVLKKHVTTNDSLNNKTHDHKHTQRIHDKSEQYCDDNELQSVQFRLLQWFKDVHEKSGNVVEKPIPAHHIVCEEHVSWMFTQWDGDDDGELTVEEMNSIENDPYERCIGPFFDRCDDNADNVLSLDEWCDCFLWANDHHAEPACHAAKHKVDPHVLGVYVPHCNIDGYYHVEQCHENYCWCVDKWGREFDNSRVEGRRPDCGQYAEPIATSEL